MVFKLLITICLLVSMSFLSSRSFGSSDSFASKNLSDPSLNDSEVIIVSDFDDKNQQLIKEMLQSSNLESDEIMLVAVDENGQLIDIDQDSSEILSKLQSEIEQTSYQSLVQADSLDEISLDQINDYSLDNDLYQHISESDIDLNKVNYASSNLGLGDLGLAGAITAAYGTLHFGLGLFLNNNPLLYVSYFLILTGTAAMLLQLSRQD